MSRSQRRRSLGQIQLRLDLEPDQTLLSFVSALAAHNGLRSIGRFCLAFGLDAAAIAQGDPRAIGDLSQLSEVPFGELMRAGTWREPTMYRHLGELVDRKDLRSDLHVCPLCLAEDQECRPDVRPEAAARYRGYWNHGLVRACPVHEAQLVALPETEGPALHRHDLAARLRTLTRAGISLPYIPLPTTPVEAYITTRLSGLKPDVPFLDALALNDALFLAEYLGTPQTNARQSDVPKNLPERLERANRGFAIAREGEETVRECLTTIAATVNPYGAAEIGLRRVFTRLFDRVQDRAGDDVASIRRILVEIGLDQCLFAFEETEALGFPLPQRDRQTIESARKRFGISDRELRAVLIELKAIPHSEDKAPANATLFEVSTVSDILSKLKDSLNLNEAASFLGLHPQQLIRICDARLLEPFFTRPSHDLKPLRYFQQADLERFMTQLASNCQRTDKLGELVDVWEAALRTCRQPIAIIAAVHSGRIGRTYRLGPCRTIRDLLVDLDDVRRSILAAPDDLMTAEDCARILSINILAVRKLMKAGILLSETGPNQVNQRRQLVVRHKVLEEFDQKFISLHALKQKLGSSHAGIARALEEVGIRPAFPAHQCELHIYRRSDLAGAEKVLEEALCERQIGRSRSIVSRGRTRQRTKLGASS